MKCTSDLFLHFHSRLNGVEFPGFKCMTCIFQLKFLILGPVSPRYILLPTSQPSEDAYVRLARRQHYRAVRKYCRRKKSEGNWVSYPVADPDFELKRGPSLDLLALPAFSLLSFLLFLPKIRGGPGPPGPSPRSATATILYNSNHVQTKERFQGDQESVSRKTR